MDEPKGERNDSGPERCCFDDWVDHWTTQATKKPTAAKVTASLLDAITEAGVTDRTVLDVGCGIGDLAIEVVARGAASGTGYDLSPKAIDEARRLAASRGVGERMGFEVGDGAQVDLPAADIVVINRVVCCYPDTENLLDHTLGAARGVFAITAPVSEGPTGWWNRLWRSEERRVGKECRSLCDWSSDVCSSDLRHREPARPHPRRCAGRLRDHGPGLRGTDRLVEPAVERTRERGLPVAPVQVRGVPNVHPRPRSDRRAHPRRGVPADPARAPSRGLGPRRVHALTRHERALRNSARTSSSGRSSSRRPRSSSSPLNRS